MAELNRQIRLAIRPVGLPRVADFHLVYSPLPSPGPGEVLVRSQYLSLDPHLRPRMNADPAGGRSLAIGEVVAGAAVGLVVRSEDSELRAGDAVEGMLGWQEYAVAGRREVTRVDPGSAPLSTALGVLGLPGLTAYFGLLDVGQPQRGETVVVSGASGAIGMVAGQIARLEHCRVVGLASGEGDVSWLRDELGFDAAAGGPNPVEDLAEFCPEGVDVYFDTAGGSTTDAVIGRLNPGARVCACGQSSQDNIERADSDVGPRWLDLLVAQQARVQGFLVSACRDRFAAGRAKLASWLEQGSIGYREEVALGLEAAPQAFIAMMQGRSQGNQLVRLW